MDYRRIVADRSAPQPGRQTLARIAVALAAAAVWTTAPACHTGPRPSLTTPQPSAAASPTTLDAQGDWDDADAAAIIGAEAVLAVVARTDAVSTTHRRYTLRLHTGETATLEIRRADDARASDPRLHLSATIGRVSDPTRERRLLEAVKTRLHQLHGVDFAPR